MKITQLFTTQEEREIEFDTPAFFNEDQFTKVAVYSEDKVVYVNNFSKGWVNVRKCAVSDCSNFINLITIAPKMSEEEFNQALAEALFNIAGVEIVPNSVTELIPA